MMSKLYPAHGACRDDIYFLSNECDQLCSQGDVAGVEYLLRKYRAKALADAAKEVCAACGGRLPTYAKIHTGPNTAGNFVHGPKDNVGRDILCTATAIYSLMAWEREHGVGKGAIE